MNWNSWLKEQLRIAQEGICPICHEKLEEISVIEHNHETGQIRGLVHKSCNNRITQVERASKKFNYIISNRQEARIKAYLRNPISLVIVGRFT